MIIDCHGHVSPPTELWAYKASIMSHRGEHGRRMAEISDAGDGYHQEINPWPNRY
jgi:4-oxalmesaconate hydratase